MVVIFAALVTGGANLELKTTGQFLTLHDMKSGYRQMLANENVRNC